MLLISCTTNKLEIIDVKPIIYDLKNGRKTMDQLDLKFSNAIYLDSSIIYLVDSLNSKFLQNEGLDIDNYRVGSEDKREILLTTRYESITDLIRSSDENLERYFEEQFGVEVFAKASSGVLIYEQKAFIELSNAFSSSGYIIELIGPDKVSLVIAYIDID
ncbi:MAG: hypothetical protein WBG62_11085 [Cyclobacteriaceae bacterium]